MRRFKIGVPFVLNTGEEVFRENSLIDFFVEGSDRERPGTVYLTNQRLAIFHHLFGLSAMVPLESIVSVEQFKIRQFLRRRRGFRLSFRGRGGISEIRVYPGIPVRDEAAMDWARGWVNDILKARLGTRQKSNSSHK